MGKQIFWEDVKEGMEIPTLVKHPSTRQLVRYAGVSGDFYEIHYDKDFAISTGLDGVILHGALKQAFLGQLMTDWIGEHGTLRKLGAQYRGMDRPGDTLLCKGRVTKKYVKGGEHLVDCEVWVENQKGEKFTPGVATAALPTRNRD
ncbi:MAG: dehydratase [SAR202 cluster bacterium]|nr:dehydratase [SAR202 cluster bacterium]